MVTGPVTTRERFMVLDALRGFALLGILIANLGSFNGWYFMSSEQKAAIPTAGADGAVRFLQNMLILGKFYTVFALLFGIGFALQFSRAVDGDHRFKQRYVRRLLVLVGIGLVHLGLWSGDILVLYALCGFLLLLFREMSDRSLIASAIVLIVLPVPYYAAMWLTGGWFDPSLPLWELAYKVSASLNIANADTGQYALIPLFKDGGFLDQLRANVPGALMRYGEIISEGRMFKVFGVFLIGLWAGRAIVRGELLDNSRWLRRVLIIGAAIGLPANIGLAALLEKGGAWPYSSLGLAQSIAYAVGVVPLALAFAAGIVMLWRLPRWQRALRVLAPPGRMALTNYIGQTLMGIAIFYGVGLGRMGTVGPLGWTILAGLIFIAQISLSALWLKYYRFGPLEWVWRQLAYGKRFALRRIVPRS